MQFNLVEVQDGCKLYESDTYRLFIMNNGDMQFQAKRQYTPDIHYSANSHTIDTTTRDFTIQTTSYGSLPVKDIQQIIAGYQAAINAINFAKDLN